MPFAEVGLKFEWEIDKVGAAAGVHKYLDSSQTKYVALLGFCDMLLLKPSHMFLLLQTTILNFVVPFNAAVFSVPIFSRCVQWPHSIRYISRPNASFCPQAGSHSPVSAQRPPVDLHSR